MEKNEWENDWLHNLGAWIVTFILMASPVICVLSFKWCYDAGTTWSGMGYVFLALFSGILAGFTSVIVYHFIKENCG